MNQWSLIVNWTLRNKIKWNFYCNWNIFIGKVAFENGICQVVSILCWPQCFNTLRPRQNGRHFPDDILKWIFLNENVRISIEISLKFVPKGQINNIPLLVQLMAWRLPGNKPLSEPMMVCWRIYASLGLNELMIKMFSSSIINSFYSRMISFSMTPCQILILVVPRYLVKFHQLIWVIHHMQNAIAFNIIELNFLKLTLMSHFCVHCVHNQLLGYLQVQWWCYMSFLTSLNTVNLTV